MRAHHAHPTAKARTTMVATTVGVTTPPEPVPVGEADLEELRQVPALWRRKGPTD